MNTDPNKFRDKNKPLTRTDVENLLKAVDNSNQLNLQEQNLIGIDLTYFNLSGANLRGAKLIGANLSEANLNGADLSEPELSKSAKHRKTLRGADLRGANLSKSDLRRTNLRRSILIEADLSEANLGEANLSEANLSKANLSETRMFATNLNRANLNGADLRNADLNGATLVETSLIGANLIRTNLIGANLREAILIAANFNETNFNNTDLMGIKISPENLQELLHCIGIRVIAGNREQHNKSLDDSDVIRSSMENQLIDDFSDLFNFSLRIIEEPLTTQNLTTIISSLTELHTKCWLIAKNRLSDLIEYTQTHNTFFAEAARLTITKLTYNSPAEIRLNINADASTQGIAEALRTAIDAVTQTPHRIKAVQLGNQVVELDIKHKDLEMQSVIKDKEQERQIKTQQAEIEKQKALIEIERQQLVLEKQRLDLQKERLDLETKRIDFAIVTANKMIDILYPDSDTQIKTMLLQTLLPNLLQLENSRGLELILLAPREI